MKVRWVDGRKNEQHGDEIYCSVLNWQVGFFGLRQVPQSFSCSHISPVELLHVETSGFCVLFGDEVIVGVSVLIIFSSIISSFFTSLATLSTTSSKSFVSISSVCCSVCVVSSPVSDLTNVSTCKQSKSPSSCTTCKSSFILDALTLHPSEATSSFCPRDCLGVSIFISITI